MGVRTACLAMLQLGALLALLMPVRPAQADEARGVGYVLSFRLGVDPKPARELVDELARATSDWHGQEARQGAPVKKSCAKSRECVRKAAKDLGVSRLGIVAIVGAGGVTRLDVRLMDANTGKEIQRTHAEYESDAGEKASEHAIFDLIPRLLPGEKATAPVVVPPAPEEPPLVEPPPPKVPPVSQIPAEPVANTMDLETQTPNKESGRRWWLWGGIGAAATVGAVAAVFLLRDDTVDGPVLELPPPQ